MCIFNTGEITNTLKDYLYLRINTYFNNRTNYNYYILKKFDFETIYNNKIDSIYTEYKYKIDNYFKDVLAKYSKNLVVKTKLQLIDHLSKYDIFISGNNVKRLDELNTDLKCLSNLTQKEYMISIKINEVIKFILNTKFNTNFTKNKKAFYEELNSNKEYYYREIIRNYFYQILEKNSSIVKYSKIRSELKNNPLNWKNLKCNIFDDSLLKEFEYLNDSEKFDLI